MMGQAQSAASLAAFLDAMPFPVYVADVATYEIIFVNRILADALIGAPGEPCYRRLYGHETPCPHCRIPALLENGLPGSAEVFELFNEIDEQWYQMHDQCISWSDGRVVKYSIAVNISALKVVQNQLAEAHAELALRIREIERLSTIDHLTQVANRLQLDRVLEAEMDRAQRSGRGFAVVLCDLDRFKSINDRFGHQAGDLALIAVARLLRTGLRRIDTVGRWGGEEFLAILPELDGQSAQAAAERLRSAIANHNFGSIGTCTASFGIAVWTAGETAEVLIRRADAALYGAKECGRNRVVLSTPSDGTGVQ